MRLFTKSLTLTLLSIINLTVYAQSPSVQYDCSKCDVSLHKLLLDYSDSYITSDNTAGLNYLNVIIKFNDLSIKKEIENLGGKVNSVIGNILTAEVPINSIHKINNFYSANRIELSKKVEFCTDTAKVLINADKVHLGASPLKNSYTGKDVIVGIIDSGIDFDHREFKNNQDSTKSRILYIWSQFDSSGTKPQDFSYGTEYSKADIDDEIDGTPAGKVKERDTLMGHGTHVAGIASGKNGIAPESDIIFVQIDFNNFQTGRILDAANYIFKKAKELGKPCVINTSFSNCYGIPLDGSDLVSLGFDYLVESDKGRAFCGSAGNSGEELIYSFHWGGFPVENDSLWIYSTRSDNIYFHISKNYQSSLKFSIEVDSNNLKPLKFVNKTNWISIDDIIKSQGQVKIPVFYNSDIMDTATIISFVANEQSMDNNEMIISFQRFPKKTNIFKIYVKGEGTFHSFSQTYVRDPAHFNKGLPIDNRYLPSDNKYLIGSPAVAKNVISVASYVNRYSYIDINGVEQPFSIFRSSPGSISDFSSRGPCYDGRIKPEITAPGTNVISASAYKSRYVDSTKLVGNGIYKVSSGTSMSCPVVTGAVALLLESNPDLTFKQIRQLLIDNADSDEYTQSEGNLPNSRWGYGKLNIFKSIASTVNDVSEHSNINDSDLFFTPNPADDYITLHIPDPDLKRKSITIFNSLGIILMNINDDELAKQNTINISVKDFPSGKYYCTLNTGINKITKSFVVVR